MKRLLPLLLVLILLVSCASKGEPPAADAPTPTPTPTATPTPEPEPDPEATPKPVFQPVVADSGKLFPRTFYFSSGVGAWCTMITVEEDLTFAGEYYDADAGDRDPAEYPNGTMYSCTFQGEFEPLRQVNDYYYATSIADLVMEQMPGDEEVIDGTLYKYSEPYGLEKAGEIRFYLPGTPASELPDPFISWVLGGTKEENGEDWVANTIFQGYGLYNVKQKYGFSG